MVTQSAVVLALLSTLSLTLADDPPPNSYWQVSPPINYSDPLYAGWPQLRTEAEVLVYKGTEFNRTYAHHPELHYDGSRTFLQYSTSPIDEDATGQEAWLSTSTDGGFTWSKGYSILPAALLPNQTSVANYSYWCDNRIWQRALHPTAWVPIGNDTLYAVSQTTLRYCWGDDAKGTKAAGRIARRISKVGQPVGDPCWTSQNNWTSVVRFNETIYGAYGMKHCQHAAQIEAYLKKPSRVPAWGTWLYQTKLFAADDTHDMQEPTHAVWFGNKWSGYWERFWRDISGSDIISNAVWVERTSSRNGSDWYPRVEQQYGNRIFRTNIPDVGSKQHLGLLPNGDRYIVHNPRNNTERIRQPLTIATSRGGNGTYTGIGVLRTNASTLIAPDTRKLKRLMFSYPTAIMVDGKLVVAYSENKENIWVSVVDPKDLR
ncbi:hypothetical protein BU23DRAFT_553634 [Bimuria novae-zelandiae CBS 107.79]|uniref:BT-1020-like N-terminal beta-propeller domain-containing protein n=1 Tax=Bimuria novae-zelandiae CBS 107.79 TaxID=1447943 RepID=A0A6A5VC85_9PLEO|nr:hypothetical protein BU23DRAFT_553634 [Bimuria novae-zelandiae CBS 107.79]